MRDMKIQATEIVGSAVVVVYTDEHTYESSKTMLVATEDIPYNPDKNDGLYDLFKDSDYIIIRGSHCSCYGYEDIEYDATLVNEEELFKLAEAPYNNDSEDFEAPFWDSVRKYLNKDY